MLYTNREIIYPAKPLPGFFSSSEEIANAPHQLAELVKNSGENLETVTDLILNLSVFAIHQTKTMADLL
jgi:hypothetical protein